MDSQPVFPDGVRAVPAFKYVATGKRVPDADFSTGGELFASKKAALEFMDLWCSGEIVREIFFNGAPELDFLDNLPGIGCEVALAVSDYHARYGLVPALLAFGDVTGGGVARVKDADGQWHYPPANEHSCNVSLEREGYQGDRFMGMVRNAIEGLVISDDEVLLHLLNTATANDVVEVNPTDATPGSPFTMLFAKARNIVWKRNVAAPAAITTPQVMRGLYSDNWKFIERPTSLSGIRFGAMATIDFYVLEPGGTFSETGLSYTNIQSGDLFVLGSPSVLGIRHEHVMLSAHPVKQDGKESIFMWAQWSTWLQGHGVGHARLLP